MVGKCKRRRSLSQCRRHRDQTCRGKPWTSDLKADHMLAGSPETESSPSQTNQLSDNSHQGAVPGSESRTVHTDMHRGSKNEGQTQILNKVF